MQLRPGAAVAHLVDVHLVPRILRVRIVAHLAHVHRLHEDRVGGGEIGHAQGDRPEAADLPGFRHLAARPGMRLPCPAVVDEAQLLALEILEVQRQAAVADVGLAMRDAAFG